jgi:hypothetical protein
MVLISQMNFFYALGTEFSPTLPFRQLHGAGKSVSHHICSSLFGRSVFFFWIPAFLSSITSPDWQEDMGRGFRGSSFVISIYIETFY